MNQENQTASYHTIRDGVELPTTYYDNGKVTLPERPNDIKVSPENLVLSAEGIHGWIGNLNLYMTIPQEDPPLYEKTITREEKKLNLNLDVAGEPLLNCEGYLYEDVIVIRARKERTLSFREFVALNDVQREYLANFSHNI